ncbi:XRE family transcriptional regulator [Kitasatospora paranensis]|uniref:XRE family transcriptional regulator n=1 Tax=Kitasatospora paranensis TaxID=258053 RepID=A0ABW2FVZ4_9ACTN
MGPDIDPLDLRLASRLAELRTGSGWSLEELARRADISRSTLSRLERAEISPTAALLGRLCRAYGRTMSQLLAEVEQDAAGLLRAHDQPVWTDPATGFVRRSVSPPQSGMRGELVEGILPADASIAYDGPSVPGLEQHLWLLAGRLELTVQEQLHRLAPGDCLRFRLWGRSAFRNPGPEPARYVLALVLP